MSGLLSIAPDLWIADGSQVDFHGFAYPTRMVVVRLSSGALWLWSPIQPSRELFEAVSSLGVVSSLVSPNKLHYLFLADWHHHFPAARIWGPVSTIRKLPDIPFEQPLGDKVPNEWAADFDQLRFHGSFALDEVIFFHRPSKTIILADMIEALSPEFLATHWSWWQRPLARLGGITDRQHKAPADLRLSFWNRKQARAARERLLSWDAGRVIMAHGEWVEENVSDYLGKSFAWLD